MTRQHHPQVHRRPPTLRALALLGLILLATLAGCASDPAPAASREATTPPTLVTPTKATENATAAPNETVTTEPFALDGEIGTTAFICAGPTSPPPLPLPCVDAGNAHYVEVPLPAGTTAVSIETIWTPASPTTQEMNVAVFRSIPCNEDEEACYDGRHYEFVGEVLLGSSPLVLERDWSDEYVAGEEAFFLVMPHGRHTDAGYTRATYTQSFHAEGTTYAKHPSKEGATP